MVLFRHVREGHLRGGTKGRSTVPAWIPQAFVVSAVFVVGVSVAVSLARDQGEAEPLPRVSIDVEEAAPSAGGVPEADLRPLPAAGNVREAAAGTRVRQLIAQYREAVATDSDARARAIEDRIIREGEIATPFVDRAIAESRNADVTAGLTRIRARLPEPIVLTDPVQGPPSP